MQNLVHGVEYLGIEIPAELKVIIFFIANFFCYYSFLIPPVIHYIEEISTKDYNFSFLLRLSSAISYLFTRCPITVIYRVEIDITLEDVQNNSFLILMTNLSPPIIELL